MIVITMGDGNGVGPEIILKAYAGGELQGDFVVMGDLSVLEYCNEKLGYGVAMRKAADEKDVVPGVLNVLDLGLLKAEDLTVGQVDAKVAAASREYVARAAQMALEGKFSAMVTLPVNKEAIRLTDPDFTGHTELIAGICDQTHYTMMLASNALTVTHVSTHVSMEQSIRNCKKQRILDVIRLTWDAISRFKECPKIAVAGLNPHAGENGAFGRQEIEEIAPAVEEAVAQGMNAFGPIPPDTVFLRAYKGEFDAVVCMYHDQGHIPLKTVGFVFDREKQTWKAVEGVNVTLGLPIIRTSVDHGTGFALAGKGTSNELSLVNAIDYAVRMAEGKKKQ